MLANVVKKLCFAFKMKFCGTVYYDVVYYRTPFPFWPWSIKTIEHCYKAIRVNALQTSDSFLPWINWYLPPEIKYRFCWSQLALLRFCTTSLRFQARTGIELETWHLAQLEESGCEDVVLFQEDFSFRKSKEHEKYYTGHGINKHAVFAHLYVSKNL